MKRKEMVVLNEIVIHSTHTHTHSQTQNYKILKAVVNFKDNIQFWSYFIVECL